MVNFVLQPISQFHLQFHYFKTMTIVKGIFMKIIDFKISNYDIIYTVKTTKGNTFSHALPKDTTSHNVHRYLNILCSNVDRTM